MNLKDQVALITGASGGIGQAIALELAKYGAKLALTGRKQNKLESLAENVAASASGVRFYPADLAIEDKVKQLSKDVLRDFGKVNIIVHSVGVISIAPFATAPLKDFDSQYYVNVRVPYLLTQTLLGSLKEQKGQVVFINSTAGLQARENLSQYAATKHALKAIADSLREEVNAQGVRVLSVFLGRTATSMQAATYAIERREYNPELLIQPEDVAAIVTSALCLPRTAEVTEIKMRPMIKC